MPQFFPNLLIDYTFELWGQKHLINYGLPRVADLDWMSNVRDQSANEAGPGSKCKRCSISEAWRYR